MKSKLLLSTALLLRMLLLSSFKNPANEQFVKFSIKNAGISVDGFFDKFQVKVVYDESNLAQSSFSGSIDVNSINTGIEMRDGHLKGEEYFDAQTYPKITFVSTSISKISSTELKVDGKL